MKIKQLKLNNKYKLLKLKLIKSKILNKKILLGNITLESIEFRIKKILYLIYLYHMYNKKIMFIGNPISINQELCNVLKTTRHVFIPKFFWISGIITNRKSSLKSLFKKEGLITNGSKQLVQLKKKCDLTVILDQQSDYVALSESYGSRIPVVTLNSNLNVFDNKTSYKVPGNFLLPKNELQTNLFYTLLLAVLKKSNHVKKNDSYLSHVLKTPFIIKKQKKNGIKKNSQLKKTKYDFPKKKSI